MFKDIFEGTVSADIAQASSGTCPKCGQKIDLDESAVGLVGRTGTLDADNHITPELRAEFKKLVKKLGGKTVARKLLAEMNPGLKEAKGMNGKLRGEIESMLLVLENNCRSKSMENAIEEVLDLMDTCQ